MKDKQKNNNKIYYTILAVVALICIGIIIFVFANGDTKAEEKELPYT